jgi:ACS family tartrate transporter-like MFS transporter
MRLEDKSDEESLHSPGMERTYVKKLLLHMVPFLAILYVFCMLDRTNVNFAALTMKQDLHLSDSAYGMGFGIFFIGYFLFEVPSNLIMEKIGARLWIARIMITWGAISACMMFVKTPLSFYTMRFLLGIAEAGFYPGVLLYLTYWVPANARAQIIARFLALTGILGLFGPPLGGLLLKMNGLYGLAGWQWLFLLEGIPSVLMGFVVFKVLPNKPDHASWLTSAEKLWITAKLERESQSAERVQHITWKVALTEPRILFLCLIFILISTGTNAVGSFSAQLIKSRSEGMWDDSFVATISVVPAIVGAIGMALAASHSDKTGNRRLHVVLGYFAAGIAFLLCIYLPTAVGLIFALSLNALGERIGSGSYWAVTTNLMGAKAAAGGLAFINSVGNLGGFFGPVIMGKLKDSNAGAYEPGIYLSAALMIVASIIAFQALQQKKVSEVPLPAGEAVGLR